MDPVGELGVARVGGVGDRRHARERLLAGEARQDDHVVGAERADLVDERLDPHRGALPAGAVGDRAAVGPQPPLARPVGYAGLVVELEHDVVVAGERLGELAPVGRCARIGQRAARLVTGRRLGLQRDDHVEARGARERDPRLDLRQVVRGVQRVRRVQPELAHLEADEVGVVGDRLGELGGAEVLVGGDVLARELGVGGDEPDDLDAAGDERCCRSASGALPARTRRSSTAGRRPPACGGPARGRPGRGGPRAPRRSRHPPPAGRARRARARARGRRRPSAGRPPLSGSASPSRSSRPSKVVPIAPTRPGAKSFAHRRR